MAGSRTRTLGDLLYAGGTAAASEKEWAGLVRAVAGGDQRALRALYEQTHRIVFTLVMRIVNDRAAAEEVTLDVFHDVWRRASAYDPAGGPVVGWIMNQARSRAIDRVRFEQRKKRAGDGAQTVALPAQISDDPEAVVAVRERGRRLRAALSVLTAHERQAIETAFFSECTYHEVATRLNAPLGTIKTRIRSGLAKLRQALAETARSL